MFNTNTLQFPISSKQDDFAAQAQATQRTSKTKADKKPPAASPSNPPFFQFSASTTLNLGRGMMLLSVLGALVALAVAYIYPEQFSLGEQVAAHISLPLMAGFFKLGYVVRLAAHHTLGNYTAG
ncbi:hypothetical protein NT239_15225 [Chitinibacter sp. SCUT-21]|uniref:hypothetical protein n=1 Tax=Chitinibacter sp. SCUT-21 TaxID=2970891 RepID=UPI0035A72642